MRIWKQPISIELLTASNANCAVTHLGIEFLEVGDDFIRARVPVDRRTVQPYGLLHGGVSVVLAENVVLEWQAKGARLAELLDYARLRPLADGPLGARAAALAEAAGETLFGLKGNASKLLSVDVLLDTSR